MTSQPATHPEHKESFPEGFRDAVAAAAARRAPFCLDDGLHLADMLEVEDGDDLTATRAITDAITRDDPLIISTGGATLTAELVADNDGAIDGYRILVMLPGQDYWLASDDIFHVGGYAGDVTVAVLAAAVATANQMVTAALAHTGGAGQP
jgi:hypothetical protein